MLASQHMTCRAALLSKVVITICLSPWAVVTCFAQPKDIDTEILGLMERLRSASPISDTQSESQRASRRAILQGILSDHYVRVSEEGTFLTKSEVLDAFVPAGVGSVSYENMRVFHFAGGAVIAICLMKFDDQQIPPWIVARVFTREGASWRLIGEDAGPPIRPLLASEVTFPLVAKRNPAVPFNERENEVRAAMERQRLAADPQSQRAYGRVIDRQTLAKYSSTDYLKVWWANDGWTNDNGTSLTQSGTGTAGAREQFIANTNPAIGPEDPRHLQANESNAYLRWENVNVAVVGDTAIITYRSLNQNASKRLPAYTVFRVWEKRAEGWLNVFSFR